MDSTTQELDKLLAASREVRRRFEPQWFVNLSFYSGQQWIGFDGRRIFEPKLEDWRVKLVDNRIQPIVRTEIAKMTKTRPTFIGVPRTADDEDIAAARLSERAFEFAWKEHDLLRKLRAALLWSRITGAGFWKVAWDKGKGPGLDVLVNPEGAVVKDGYGAPMKAERLKSLPEGTESQVTSKRVSMGDVEVSLRTPWEIFPDPLCGEEGIQSAEWCIEEAVYSQEYVRSRFGEEVDEDSYASAGIVESRMPGETRGAAGYRGVRLREYWCKPGSEHPRGKRVVWAGEKILVEEENPYPWLPYVMFRGVPVPGRFWPGSVTEQLISPQAELNKAESQIAENAERIGNPPLLKSTSSDFEWHGLPGEVIEFQDMGTPGSVPSFLQIPELPGYVQSRVDRIESSFREISGQHEVTQGAVPAGVTAASAINLLQEQDDTRLGPDIADMEQSITEAGRRILHLIGRLYTDERMLRLSGDDGAWDIEAFKGDMLRGHEDIEVQAGSGLPQSKAAKQAAIQQMLTLLIQNGQAPDPRTMRKVLRDLEVGALESFYASMARDERQVNEENRRLLAGEGFEINAFDNDEVHIAGHEDIQKSSRYSQLAKDPKGREIQGAMEEHVAAHRTRMDEKQLAAQPPEMPGPGGPQEMAGAPGPGGPEPPPGLEGMPPQ